VNELARRIILPSDGRARPVAAHCSGTGLAGPAGASATSRALVAVSRSPAPDRSGCAESPRPSAAFLAHVIATAQHAPQTRARRRAEPRDAGALYAAACARRIDAGGSVSRAI
jgi:hypothetical protein